MRSVKASRGKDKRTRPAGRGKSPARAPAPRAEPRSRAKTRADDDSEPSRFAWLNVLPRVRHPMLVLTLGVVIAGGAMGLIAGGYIGGAFTGVRDGARSALGGLGFSIHDIAITGNERTAAGDVQSALGMTDGDSIFALDPAAARAKLLTLPWVADAEVRRTLPDMVSVRLIEKRPFALWGQERGYVVVERSGTVITGAERSAFARLPVLLGTGAPEAAAPLIDALDPDKAIKARLVAIQRVAERRWDLILAGGVTVKLPEDGWEPELAELERLIVEKGVLERDIEMIDLRYPDSYVFRLHNGDSRPVPRERRA